MLVILIVCFYRNACSFTFVKSLAGPLHLQSVFDFDGETSESSGRKAPDFVLSPDLSRVWYPFLKLFL